MSVAGNDRSPCKGCLVGPQHPQNTGTGAPCGQNHQLCTTALNSWFRVKPASSRPKRDSHCLAAGLEVGHVSLLAPSCAGTACTLSQRSISMSSLALPLELSSLQRGSSATFSFWKVRAQKIHDSNLFIEKILCSIVQDDKFLLQQVEVSSQNPFLRDTFS